MKPVVSLVAILAASLATTIASAATDGTPAASPRHSQHQGDAEAADSPAPHRHVREVGAAKKRNAAAHGRGRHDATDPKKDSAASARAPHHEGPQHHATHVRVAAATHAAPADLAPSVVIGMPAAEPAAPPPSRAPMAEHGCQKHAVEITSGKETGTFSLTMCDGRPAPLAVERLSILSRPEGIAKPAASLATLARVRSDLLSPGVRRLSVGLLERMQKVVDHFARPGKTPHIVVVSAYRAQNGGSFHAAARAMDFRVEGVSDQALVAFCKTLTDTGCGYYPNSPFIHMDARDPGAGHVAWIDASEAPRSIDGLPPLPSGTVARNDRHGRRAAHPGAAPAVHADHQEPEIDPPAALLGVPDLPETWQP